MTTLNLFIFGQSFAEYLLTNPIASETMKQTFLRHGVTLNLYGYVSGGSSVLKSNVNPATPTRYWWNDTTNSAGPLLTSAIAYIATIPSGSKPTKICMGLGENDAFFTGSDTTAFKAGNLSILAALRTALGNGAGCVMQPVGRRINPVAVPGVQIIREAQIEMAVASLPFVFGGDAYDLGLLGDDPLVSGDAVNSHFVTPEIATYAWRMTQRLLQSILVSPTRMPPSAGIITRSGNDIVVPILPGWDGAEIIIPTAPSHLAIRDSVGVIESPDLGFSSSSSTLTITPNRSFGDGHFLAPYGQLNTIDRLNLIRDSVHRFPLRTTKAAIPVDA